MSSSTQRLLLKKPDSADQFLRQDFADNYDKIDAAPGDFICTSTTRPTWGAGQAGRKIYETDTHRAVEWTGTAWLIANGMPVVKQLLVKPAVFLTPYSQAVVSVGSVVVDRPTRLVVDLRGVYFAPNYDESTAHVSGVETYGFINGTGAYSDNPADISNPATQFDVAASDFTIVGSAFFNQYTFWNGTENRYRGEQHTIMGVGWANRVVEPGTHNIQVGVRNRINFGYAVQVRRLEARVLFADPS